MNAIDSRIRRLQGRLCPDNGQPQRLWVLVKAGYGLALDQDRCFQILGECGFLPTGRFGVVNFLGIPDDLNAKELEQFLRRNGAETCGFGGDQEHGRPGGARQLDDTKWSSQAQIGADWGR
jgi:hypothetical protein